MFQEISLLFKTPLRAKIVAYFVRRRGEWVPPADVASIVGASKEVTVKEISSLFRFGIIVSRKIRDKTIYRINEHDMLYEPLARFLAEVAIPTDKEIMNACRGIRGVSLIVAGGLLVNEAQSPVELLIVCKNQKDATIAAAIKKLEMFSATPLRYAVFSAEEYSERRRAYDRMLRDLFEFRHRVVFKKSQ